MSFLRYMPDSPPPASHLAARTRRSEETWAAARADYLAGGSATEVCERHDLSLSTFRWRARNEGWRRADHPESPVDAPFADTQAPRPAAEPEALHGDHDALIDAFWAQQHRAPPAESAEEMTPSAPPPEPVLRDDDYGDSHEDLAGMAWRQGDRAIRMGRMIEARGWFRLYRELKEHCQRAGLPARLEFTNKLIADANATLDDLREQIKLARREL